jgi:hypothetical protein
MFRMCEIATISIDLEKIKLKMILKLTEIYVGRGTLHKVLAVDMALRRNQVRRTSV